MQLTLRRPTVERRWLITAIVCSGVFMSSLDLFIVNIAFPSIAHSLGDASLSSLSWVVSGYAIVFAALLVPAGRWADAFGRKRAFQLGLAIFALASAACAAAPSLPVLIAARIVQAAGGAMMLPTSLGLILPEFPPRERHLAIGAWAATGAIAAAAGPPLGGLLVQANWRLVFLVNVPVAIVALIAGRRTTGRAPGGERADPGSARSRGLRARDHGARAGDRQGARLGLARRADGRPGAHGRRCCWPASGAARSGTPRRSSTRRCSASRRSGWLWPDRCCSSPASPRCCSAASCS